MRHQQHLARAVHRFAVGVPEAHQGKRAEADHFPAKVEDEQVCAVHQRDKAADENQHCGVEARGRLVVRHIADRIEQHQAADARAHEGEENAERVDVQYQRERPVPRQGTEVDGLAAANKRCDAGDGKNGGQAAESSEDSLGPGGAKPRDENLQHCAQQERAWSHNNEGGRIHGFMLSAGTLGQM